MNFKKRQSGETLLEALVAIAVLLITLGWSHTIVSGGIRDLNSMRNRATAIFLAQEGIEGVKNIMGGNLLRLSGDIQNCWNAGWTGTGVAGDPYKPVVNTSDCTVAANKIGKVVVRNSAMNMRLLFDSNADEGRSLFRVEKHSTNRILSLTNSGCPAGVEAPCFTDGTSAKFYGLQIVSGQYTAAQETTPSSDIKFYRSVIITYVDNIGDLSVNALKAKSKVIWQQGGIFKTIEYSTYLTRDHAL